MVSAHVVSIEGEYATLTFLDGQVVHVSVGELPQDIAIGHEILVNFGRNNDELAQSILNQLLEVSNVTKNS